MKGHFGEDELIKVVARDICNDWGQVTGQERTNVRVVEGHRNGE